MRKAVAIAIPLQQNPFHAAYESASNFSVLLADFLFGNAKRINITISVMMALLALSIAINTISHNLLQTCAV